MFGPDERLTAIEITFSTQDSTNGGYAYWQGFISTWLLASVFPDWGNRGEWFALALQRVVAGERVKHSRSGYEVEIALLNRHGFSGDCFSSVSPSLASLPATDSSSSRTRRGRHFRSAPRVVACCTNAPYFRTRRQSQNTDAKLLINQLLQKGRVLAQDGVVRSMPPAFAESATVKSRSAEHQNVEAELEGRCVIVEATI